MIEALARIRNDSVLSRPGKRSAPSRALLALVIERLRSLPARFYIGAILSALLVGIGVNALILQRERHPAPLFAPPAQKVAAPAPIAAPPPPPAPPAAVAVRETPAAAPPPPPPPARAAASDAVAPHATDPIGALLRGGEAPADNARLVVAAQSALAKLGYSVKADGAQGAATDQALHEFEKAHGLPISTEITPRLIKQLNSAARSFAR
jgi:type IV secretory pathway VirB10-like protein